MSDADGDAGGESDTTDAEWRPGPTDATPDPPSPPATDLGFLPAAVDAADADAFVAVGDRFDDDLRYCTRFGGPDRDYALVVTGGDAPVATLCAPALFVEQAEREFVADAPADGVRREVRADGARTAAGKRAARVVTDLVGDGAALLTPQSIPHDAAVYLQQAGHEVASTPAVAEARTRKTAAEVDCLRFVQRAATRGMARAETVLAECAIEDDRLVWEGDPLTTERLRREVNAAMAARGVRDAGNTVIGAGPTAADLHYTGVDAVRPGETVLLDLSPRGPHGYYADITRTFVVDGDGGWERRAYLAVESAREAALAEIEPGVTASLVHQEAAAELTAYGFDPSAGEGEAGFTHGTGHGVGVSLHEAPSLSADTELEPGHVVTVEPGVYDPATGGVRLEDLVVVTEEGYEILATYPFGIAPERR